MSSLYERANIPYDQKRQGIYTDLDTLYDTRIAVVEEVDTLLALRTLQAGWAWRVEDKAPPIPDDKYKELYDSRDINTLVKASPTFAAEAIRAWYNHALNAMHGTPFPGYCELFVNVWPYKLTKEQATSYAEKLRHITGDFVRITMLNINPEHITALDAKMYFSVMFVNDWYVWLEARAASGDIKDTPLPNVALHAPKICRGTINQGEYEQIKDIDIFTTVEERLRPIIGLEFMEVAFFSSVLTPDVATAMIDKYLLEQENKKPTA